MSVRYVNADNILTRNRLKVALHWLRKLRDAIRLSLKRDLEDIAHEASVRRTCCTLAMFAKERRLDVRAGIRREAIVVALNEPVENCHQFIGRVVREGDVLVEPGAESRIRLDEPLHR